MAVRVFTRKEREVWQACEMLWEAGLPLQKITINTIGIKLIDLLIVFGGWI